MRLFVGVRPPEHVLDQLDALVAGFRAVPGASHGPRWSGRPQWHVTLRFLGQVIDPNPVVRALEHAKLPKGVVATLGPTVGLLGRHVVCLPVDGLEPLATRVREVTQDLGEAPEKRRFVGHLTLARIDRGRGSRRRASGALDVTLPGSAITASWVVEDVVLLRSHLGAGGPRYEELYAVDLRL